MNDRIDEIKTKWNFDVTLPMAAPWGKDDVVWLVGEVERLRAEAERANVTEIKRLRGTLYTVMGACDAECAACTVDFVNEALAKRGLDPLDEEQAFYLANPTADPEQTEGVLEDLHRMGVEVAQ